MSDLICPSCQQAFPSVILSDSHRLVCSGLAGRQKEVKQKEVKQKEIKSKSNGRPLEVKSNGRRKKPRLSSPLSSPQ